MCEYTPVTVGYRQRPLRPQPAAADDGHLAVHAGQLRQQQHTNTTSVVKFIEDNWLQRRAHPRLVRRDRGQPGRPQGGLLDFNQLAALRPVILNPTTGAVVSDGTRHVVKGKKK